MSDRRSEDFDECAPENRAAWRRWLAEHHADASGVWLVSHNKRSGRQELTVAAAVEEALCFGWIDSRLHPIDDETSALLFTPRRPRGTWSRLNKERVASLTAKGLMTPAGLRAVEVAQQNGSWTALDSVEALEVPPDLARALDARPEARAHFDAFSPSARKSALWWIESAKRAETRASRVAATVDLAARNLTVDERRHDGGDPR